jgi:hypothetical protein
MSSGAGDTYTASIPGTGSAAVFDYYIIAENSYAQISIPINAPTNYYSFLATQAPEIVHQAIAEYYVNLWGALITTQLVDISGIDLSNSYVEWKVNGTIQAPISFSSIGGDNFTANFPSEVPVFAGDLIEYKLVAQDLSAEHNISTDPTSGFYSFLMTDRISFEQNQFSHNWNFQGDADWFVTDFDSQHGSFSMRSGEIPHSSTSSISISFDNEVPGMVSFYKKVSSEMGYDYLGFYIDDIMQEEWSGITNWSQQTFYVTAGSHTLKWEYVKDVNASEGSDTAWIDNITFPGDSSIATDEIILESMSVYPNPANDSVFINYNINSSEKVTIKIYSISGKLIKNIENHKSNNAILVSDMVNGLYVIKIKTNKYTRVAKLLVKK